MNAHPITVQSSNDLIEDLVQYLTALDTAMSKCPMLSNDEVHVTDWMPEIVRRVTPPSGLGNVVSRILLDAAGRSESVGAGSGPATLLLTIYYTLEILKKIASGEEPQKLLQALQHDVRDIQELIQVETRWPILAELQHILDSISKTNLERDLVKTAIDLAGLEGRIFVETTTAENSSVELLQDHTFKLSPVPEVLDFADTWNELNVRVGIIDGFIERVSEIHMILDKASTHAEPVILFCRGYSEEVVATIGLNRKRGTLNVIPIVVPFDANTANTLKDIAVILDSDVISALKGQMISTLEWDNMPVADEIRWSAGVLSIRSDLGCQGLNIHIRHLMTRRADLPADGRRDIIDDRLRSLSSFGVGIKVGGSNATHHAQIIDLLLRTARSIISHGVVDTCTVVEKIDKTVLTNTLEKVDFLSIKPAITLAAVIKYSMEATASIVNIGAAVLLDR